MSTPRKVRYEPLHNGVLIEEDNADEKTKGGIILPPSARSKMNQGTIVAVGKGLIVPATGERIPMDVKVGMRVTWQQYGGAEIKVDGRPYILVRESEINGILHPAEPGEEVVADPTPDPAKEAEAPTPTPQPLNETAPAPRALPAPVTKADLFADAVAESASELTATVVADKPKNLPLPGEGLPEPVPLPKRSG